MEDLLLQLQDVVAEVQLQRFGERAVRRHLQRRLELVLARRRRRRRLLPQDMRIVMLVYCKQLARHEILQYMEGKINVNVKPT